MAERHGHVPIEETPLFLLFEDCSETCWNEVTDWAPLEKQTVGRQLVRAMDSVGANLVEGDGRYRPDDALNHFVIARASAREAILWCTRAQKRGLFKSDVSGLLNSLKEATIQLNRLIRFRRSNAKGLKSATSRRTVDEPTAT